MSGRKIGGMQNRTLARKGTKLAKDLIVFAAPHLS